jgi:hypothetical protein
MIFVGEVSLLTPFFALSQMVPNSIHQLRIGTEGGLGVTALLQGMEVQTTIRHLSLLAPSPHSPIIGAKARLIEEISDSQILPSLSFLEVPTAPGLDSAVALFGSRRPNVTRRRVDLLH